MSSDIFHYKQNRLQQLRGFCQVARTGSVSKAAKEMQISQPTVTQQIKALERDFGVELVVRKGQRMELTQYGQLLLKLALPHVEPLDRLHETFVIELERRKADHITIGANQPTLMYLLPALVKSYCDANPEILVRLKYTETPESHDLLRRDALDCIVGTSPQVLPRDLHYIPIYEFETLLVMPKGHPLANQKKVSLADIAQYSLILPAQNRHSIIGIEAVLSRYGAKRSMQVELDDWELVRKYVEAGVGLSIISAAGFHDEPKLHAISLQHYFPNVTYGVTVLEGKPIPLHVRDWIETMQRAEQ